MKQILNIQICSSIPNHFPPLRHVCKLRRTKQIGFLFLPFIFTVLFSCQQPQETNTVPPEEQPTTQFSPYENSEITVEPFKVDSMENNGSSGWGYNILIDGKLYIHQPNIPAIMGNNGFSSEEKAREAGEFIVEKIRKKILPPSVTAEELESRGLLD
jgi:hypothetical protein